MSMMMANTYEKYRQQGVLTASSLDLIVMLYDGCIKQLKISKAAMEGKHFEKANNSIKRAQDIISELIRSLDLSFTISKDLMSLYEFMIQEMIRINMEKDIAGVQPLLEMLEGLRDAWSTIRKQQQPVSGLYGD